MGYNNQIVCHSNSYIYHILIYHIVIYLIVLYPIVIIVVYHHHPVISSLESARYEAALVNDDVMTGRQW